MAGRKKSIGKIFEDEFRSSVPGDCYLERYKDDTSGFYGVSNPADFRLYIYPVLILLELKSHRGKSLPLDNIRDNQLRGMLRAVNHYGVYGGFLVNFRELEETYFLSVGYVEKFINSEERKSIPVEYFRENGVRIPQKKKRTLYKYDLSEWLRMYSPEMEER